MLGRNAAPLRAAGASQPVEEGAPEDARPAGSAQTGKSSRPKRTAATDELTEDQDPVRTKQGDHVIKLF